MKYIKYEVEQNTMWGRPYLVGLYINEKGKTIKDWLLGFGSNIKNNEAKIELQRIANFYNTALGIPSAEDQAEDNRVKRVLAEGRRLAKNELKQNEKDL